jgi:CheY-like chemotaxis protein
MLPTKAPLVLLVDDHADTRDMYEQMLVMSSFNVAQAEDGPAALARLDEQLPSIVVTDLHMPGAVSALDLCCRLQEKGVPVIVLTGIDAGRELDQLLAAGCEAVLLKPVAPDVLVSEIRRVLSSAQAPPQPT